MSKRVIILEDDLELAKRISDTLSGFDYQVKITGNSDDFFDLYDSFFPDVIIVDIVLEGSPLNGLEVMRVLHAERDNNAKIIVISGEANAAQIDEIRHMGAYHFIEKGVGFSLNQLLLHLENAIQLKRQEEAILDLQIENINLKKQLVRSYPFIGESPAIKQVRAQIIKLAEADEDMFLIGETGTGKEVAVHYYYLNSKRFGRAFNTVNCSALTETLIESELFGHSKGSFTSADRNRTGYFEKCTNGILFLDEVTNLSLPAQAKILRAIENKEIQVVGGELKKVNTRLIFASNADIERLSKPEIFRQDLFYRIEGNVVELPPLRERGNDIMLLMSFFFTNYAADHERTDVYNLSDLFDMLQSYPWPGNIRELKNFCKFILINEKEITNEVIQRHLKAKILKYEGISETALHKYIKHIKLKDSIGSFERDFLLYHLSRNRWRISHTARQLGIERTTLYKKMKAYKLIPVPK